MKHRWLRRLGIAALVLVAIIALSTTVNLIMGQRERASTTPYGERVSVAGGEMNVWTNGQQGKPTIVLLGGLGTASPAMDFAPLIRELDGYNIVVVEGFGYGYSDMRARPRTLENITGEIHGVLTKLNVERPYVIAGHSIAGFYILSYADRYPDEVSAVIGIDPTVPSKDASATDPGSGGINWGWLLDVTGVVRAANTILPDLAEPTSDAYTADERRRMRLMSIWTFGNPALADETRRIGSNATALRGITYPDTVPVLVFLSKDTLDTQSDWVARHEDQLRNVRRQEIVVLDGPHYIHWTQSKAMAEKIKGFLATN